jgi:hypothetical protein
MITSAVLRRLARMTCVGRPVRHVHLRAVKGGQRAAAPAIATVLTLLAPNAAVAAMAPDGPAALHSPINCGHDMWLLRPEAPRNFDPRTASAAALRAADFPPRPSDPGVLPTWRRYAAKYAAGKVAQASVCPGKPLKGHSNPLPLKPGRPAGQDRR